MRDYVLLYVNDKRYQIRGQTAFTWRVLLRNLLAYRL